MVAIIRKERRPFLIHAKVPLLNHHTSGVRKEWYRDDLEEAQAKDPFPKFRNQLIVAGFDSKELNEIEKKAKQKVEDDYQKALLAEDPRPEDLFNHDFAPTSVLEEKGEREPEGKEKTVMVDSALFAIRELMAKHPECLCGNAFPFGAIPHRRLDAVGRTESQLQCPRRWPCRKVAVQWAGETMESRTRRGLRRHRRT